MFERLTIIVPTFNGAQRLPNLLTSIRSQDCDHSLYDILAVDDDSSDDTREIAERFGARVVRNGHRDIEYGKAIGIAEAKTDAILFLDDDLVLPHKDWLMRHVVVLQRYPEAIGAQPARFSLKRSDPLINRWCSMFGCYDPMPFYLGRRDHLASNENAWCLAGKIITEDMDCWLIEFNDGNVPTIGSNGYITRKSTITTASWWPQYFHIDNSLDLIRSGRRRVIITKDEIYHANCATVRQQVTKLKRNAVLWVKYSQLRSYKYEAPPLTLMLTVLSMITVVRPFMDAIKMYGHTRDIAAFLHVYLSVKIPIMYMSVLGWPKLRELAKSKRVT